MLSTKNIADNNIAVNNVGVNNVLLFKRASLFLVLICSLIQLYLSNNLRDIVNLILIIVSNVVVINYCLNEKIFHKYPISLFIVFWSSFFSLGSALLFKTLELDHISNQLILPTETILFLTIANFAIILSHLIYRRTNFFGKFSDYLKKLNFKLDIMNVKDNNLLYFCGAIVVCMFLFLGMSKIPLQDIPSACWAAGRKTLGCGPSIFRDISNGIGIFMILPFLAYTSFYLFKKKKENTKYILLLIFFLGILYSSVGSNARSTIYDLLFSFLLILIVLFLLGHFELFKANLLKYFIIFLISLYALEFIEKVSRLYIIERHFAHQSAPGENVKSFYKNLKNAVVNQEKLKFYDSFIQLQSRGGLHQSAERYYKSSIYERINVISFADNLMYAETFLNNKQRAMVIKYQRGVIISIIPQPIINLFSRNFDKSEYARQSTAAYTYKLMQPRYGSPYDPGHTLVLLKIYFGYIALILLIPFAMIAFIIFDSFYSPTSRTFSPIILIHFYATSGSALTFFAASSIDVNLAIILRGIPQSIIIYLIMKKVYEFTMQRI